MLQELFICTQMMIGLIAKNLSIPSLEATYTWIRAGNQDFQMAMYLFQAT